MRSLFFGLAVLLITVSAADARQYRSHRVAAAWDWNAPGFWRPFPGTLIEHRTDRPGRRFAATGTRRHAAVRTARHIQSRKQHAHQAAPEVAANGLVGPLADKVAEIVKTCGSRLISAVRHTFIAGTRRISLHASGKAADVAGNPSCIYAALKDWKGGYSVDYGRVAHVHLSYDPDGRREWGARFVHGGHRRHYAHGHRKHYAHHRPRRYAAIH